MANYKNSYTTKEEYIKMLIANYKHWIKIFATSPIHRDVWAWKISNIEGALIAEGFDWEQLEAIENEVYAEIA